MMDSLLKEVGRQWRETIWMKLAVFYVAMVVVAMIVMLTFVPFANAHGNHGSVVPPKEQNILNQVWMDRCSYVFYVDRNNNGLVDWVTIFSICNEEGVHVSFDDTYPKFIKEFGNFWKWE